MTVYGPKPRKFFFGTTTLSVVLIYAVLAALWILVSDKMVETMFSDPEQIIRSSMIKGWLFVVVTTLLLYVLVKGQVTQLQAAHRREIETHLEKQRSLDLLAAIADGSEDAIFAKDAKGRYRLFNNAASRFVGKPPADVLGRDDRALFSPEQAEMLMATDRRILAEGQTNIQEESLDTAIGRRIFLATKGPLRDADHKIIGTFGISRDITTYKQIETTVRESESLLRGVLGNAESIVWMKDGNGRFMHVNPYTERVLGRCREEILGRTVADLFPWSEASLYIENDRQVLATGRAQDFEETVQFADGLHTYLSTKFPLRDAEGKIYALGAICTDITDRKRVEEELRQRNEELERFNRAAIGRELDMIELKKQINALARELGRTPPHNLAFLDEHEVAGPP